MNDAGSMSGVRRLFGCWLPVVTASTLVVCSAAIAQQVVVDNSDAPEFSVISGTWATGSFGSPWGADYRWISTVASGTDAVEWRPDLPLAGSYEVELWYVAGGNRADDAPFTIHHSLGSPTILVDQQLNGEQWVTLGVFPFDAGTTGYVSLTNDAAAGAVVVGDAVRFSQVTVTQEFRGMWATRFEWPSRNLTTVQNNIDSIMVDLQANNFNAVVLQIRGQADTLYPSPNEPWSPILSDDGGTPTGWGAFDPLSYAIGSAHSRGLEFHAYINTHTCWQSGPATPPLYALDHVYWDHCDASDPAARDWLIHDESGIPVQYEESDYVWIAPGVPAAQAYVREQVMWVVANYDVDGVHFDRIRSPGPEYSHDPISVARLAGEGNPDALSFEDWSRDQFTRFLSDLYAQIAEIKPQVKVSSAPLGLYASDRYPGYPGGACAFLYGFSCVYQDAQAWLAAGVQDFIVPQIYWADNGINPEFSEVLPDWVANNSGRHVYAGQSSSMGSTELESQIIATRSIGGDGNVVFSYGGFDSANLWANYSGPNGPYAAPAAVPDMEWKTSPTEGIIIGNVVDVDDVTPVVDCQITRSGSAYTALSSGDGLYSFLKVPPGTYTLDFDKPGVGTRQVGNVSVVAGSVTRVDVSFAVPPLPGDYDHDMDVDLDDYPFFEFCLAGPTTTYGAGHFCLDGDADDDLDIDLADFAVMQRLFTP